MDIKSRNIRYSWGLKAVAAVLVWFCFVSAMGSGVFLLYNRSIADSGSYFETSDYKYRFARLVHAAVEMNVILKSEEKIKSLNESEDSKTEKLYQYRSDRNAIDSMVNFKYYIRNTAAGESYTNMTEPNPVDLLKKQPGSIYIGPNNNNYSLPYSMEIETMLSGTGYEVYAAVQTPMKPGDFFYDDYMSYTRTKSMLYYAYPLLITSVILLVVAAAYLAYAAGRREKEGEIVFLPVDRIYTDVHTLLVILAAFISLLVVINIFHPEGILGWVGFLVVMGIDALIGISYVLSMIRQFKAGRILENTLIFTFAKLCFGGKLFMPSVLLMLLGYGLINGILFDLGVDLNIGNQKVMFTTLLIAFNTAALYYTAKVLRSLSYIMEGAKQISSGNTAFVMDSSKISLPFAGLAEDIKSIQSGLKRAVSEAVRGERMKTELITNVSHDLKTPLTSIVNYVDLLKNEQLENPKVEEYVGILEEKSARLKQLVEDLVEASKASSGNMPVNAEKVDLHELVLQACGEYEEKIKEAELDIRINAEEKNIYIYADGKQMWRIIENLLSNAVKYSMPKTRVYIDLHECTEYGSLTIKNVSAFPLDIPPAQLTERFVRGDASRTTEGSGLGLSIAQSLTALQGGSFNIEIDGDLFKVNVEIPLWTEQE